MLVQPTCNHVQDIVSTLSNHTVQDPTLSREVNSAHWSAAVSPTEHLSQWFGSCELKATFNKLQHSSIDASYRNAYGQSEETFVLLTLPLNLCSLVRNSSCSTRVLTLYHALQIMYQCLFCLCMREKLGHKRHGRHETLTNNIHQWS